MAGRSRAARVARASLRRRIHGGRHVLVRFAPRECHPIVPRSPGEGTSERVVRADKGGGWRWWDGLKTLGRRLHESFLQCQIDGMWACGRRARWRRALRRGSRGLSSQTSGIASAEIAQLQSIACYANGGSGSARRTWLSRPAEPRPLRCARPRRGGATMGTSMSPSRTPKRLVRPRARQTTNRPATGRHGVHMLPICRPC